MIFSGTDPWKSRRVLFTGPDTGFPIWQTYLNEVTKNKSFLFQYHRVNLIEVMINYKADIQGTVRKCTDHKFDIHSKP